MQNKKWLRPSAINCNSTWMLVLVVGPVAIFVHAGNLHFLSSSPLPSCPNLGSGGLIKHFPIVWMLSRPRWEVSHKCNCSERDVDRFCSYIAFYRNPRGLTIKKNHRDKGFASRPRYVNSKLIWSCDTHVWYTHECIYINLFKWDWNTFQDCTPYWNVWWYWI